MQNLRGLRMFISNLHTDYLLLIYQVCYKPHIAYTYATMLFTLLVTVLLNPFYVCSGEATYQEEYRGSYTPDFIQTEFGRQIVAPDTPYIAASGPDRLYFIDTRHTPKTAQHIKTQIERAMVGHPEEYISLDEFAATAEVKNSTSGETIFVFDPPYARVLFARGMNRHNPSLKLPEHQPAGDWEVTYALDNILMNRANTCSDHGCYSIGDCRRITTLYCTICHHYRVDNECDAGQVNSLGGCIRVCSIAADAAREDGETDASYYQRMDKLHWS